MEKRIRQIIFLLAAATFFMPLLVVPHLFVFPFIVPKILLFRILSVSMFVCFVLLTIIDSGAYKIKQTPITIGVGFFLLSATISTFIGVDWYRSFWDNHERMLGLFTFFHFGLYYAVLTYVFRELKEFRKLARIFLFAGSLVMVIALNQRFLNPQFLLNSGATRVTSTLGNSIYVSGYGLFLFFLGLVSFFQEREAREYTWMKYALVCASLGFFGIFLGGTRGTLLGLLASVGVMVLLYLYVYRKTKNVRNVILTTMIGACLVTGVLFAYRTTEIVRNIPAVGGVLNLSFSTGSANTRIMAWGIAIDSWKEKPIFGWGPNNYYYAFNKYYRPEFLNHGYNETWFDNAHNIVMNTLSTQGLFGLLVYLFLFFLVIGSLWRWYRREDQRPHVPIILIGFFVAHFVHNIFVFENPTSYLYFFFMLAFVNTLIYSSGVAHTKTKKSKKRNVSTGMIGSVLIALILFVVVTNVNPARANMSLIDAIKKISTGDVSTDLYKKVILIPTPHVDDIRNDFARYSSGIMNKLFQANRMNGVDELFTLTYDELSKNRIIHPMDIRIHIMQAQFVQLRYMLTKDVSWLFKEEKLVEEALAFSPKRQQLQFMLATAKLHVQKFDEARAVLQQSIVNNPSISEGWVRLASVYYEEGNKAGAVKIIDQARAAGVLFSPNDEKVIGFMTSTTEDIAL